MNTTATPEGTAGGSIVIDPTILGILIFVVVLMFVIFFCCNVNAAKNVSGHSFGGDHGRLRWNLCS